MKLALALLLTTTLAHAEVRELYAKTDVGEIVLTAQPCDIPNPYGFDNMAYAMEGKIKHDACWYASGDGYNVWYYDEPDHPVGTYGGYYFKVRQ
jgi:hypothetical protein